MQRSTNPAPQLATANKLYRVVTNISGSSGWSLLQVTFLTLRILRRLLPIYKFID
jgi:hypothetical protein